MNHEDITESTFQCRWGIEMMFDTVRVGDKIWTVQLGRAEVREIRHDEFMAKSMEREGGVRWYGKNGKWGKVDAAPSAFWSRPVFEEPPPPKRMRRVRVERRVHIFWTRTGWDAVMCIQKECPSGCFEHFDISHEFEVEEE